MLALSLLLNIICLWFQRFKEELKRLKLEHDDLKTDNEEKLIKELAWIKAEKAESSVQFKNKLVELGGDLMVAKYALVSTYISH